MKTSELKMSSDQLRLVSFILGVAIIILSSYKLLDIRLILAMTALSGLISFKKSYLGALGFILLCVGVACIPEYRVRVSKISPGTLPLRYYLPYLVSIIAYLEVMSKARITYYLYEKHSLREYALSERRREVGSVGPKAAEAFYRIAVFSAIYIALGLIYNWIT